MFVIEEVARIFAASFLVACIAICYVNVLAFEKCCSWWFQWGSKFEGKWFWEPIWGCHKCVAGQIALWSYLIGEWCNYRFTMHVSYILISILVSACLNVVLQKFKLI
jgi:hypothetical protein